MLFIKVHNAGKTQRINGMEERANKLKMFLKKGTLSQIEQTVSSDLVFNDPNDVY